MESIKVAIQLHWLLWPPRYVKLEPQKRAYLDTNELLRGRTNTR